MKSSFIAASLIALSTFASANDIEESYRTEVVIDVTATRFVARNHGSIPHVLLFRSSERGPVFAQTLPPAGSVDFAFPRHALAGIELEVLQVPESPRTGGRTFANSGLVRLGDAFAEGTERVFVQSTPEGPFLWLERHDELVPHLPDDTFVPPTTSDREPGMRDFRNGAASSHVPVVTPREKPDDYGPPELGNKPLPPV